MEGREKNFKKMAGIFPPRMDLGLTKGNSIV